MMAVRRRHIAAFTDWDDLDIGPAVAILEAAAWEVRLIGSRDPDRVAELAADADALCVGYVPVTAELLDRLPSLSIIATSSAGFDTIDVEAASARGIWVANLPALATEEVAVHTLTLALSLTREIPRMTREVRCGEWSLSGQPLPRSTQEMTFGLLGLGRIGTRVAQLASGFFPRIVAHDPALDAAQTLDPVELVDRKSLLSRADVLSLHLPHRLGAPPEIDRAALDVMRPGAFLINTSRGALIDVEALLQALESGKVAGAALDVLDAEPPPAHHPLVNHPRVIVTPHAAFLSARTMRRYPQAQAENLLAWARSGRPLTPVTGLSA
jgi:phosphoglycerate dehydrogenase-like enzyme